MFNKLNPFSIFVILGCALISWKAMALPSSKIHLLENLSPAEAKVAHHWIQSKGYQILRSPLFHESKDTLVITKVLETEIENPSIQIEILRHEGQGSLPYAVFQIKLETQDLVEALKKIPAPGKISSIPVAYQSRLTQ